MRLRRRAAFPSEPVLVVTTDCVPGREIEEVVDLVSGIASGRVGALRKLVDDARDAGADAVLAVRFDSSSSGGAFVSRDLTFAYGTGVRLRPHEPR